MSLFGLDIPNILRDGITSAGGLRPLTLIKVTPGTRAGANLPAGTNPTEASYPGEGFFEDKRGVANIEGDLIRTTTRYVSILGASLPAGISPAPSDKIVLDGTTYRIAQDGVTTDPARALYKCNQRSDRKSVV